MYLSHPKIKDGCAITLQQGVLVLSYLGEDYTIELDDPSRASPMERFVRALDGTRDTAELCSGAGGLAAAEAQAALDLLDDSLLLTEGAQPRPGKSGLAFATELEDLYYNVWMHADGETALVKAIFDGHAEHAVLHGWCLESYHVTSRAHDCLSPMLARFHGASKRLAIAYFLDEYRHDKLIMKSLLAAGFQRDEVERSLPLPYTHAVMNLLARWAHSDLLSFMGCLFVFEGTREIGDGYIRSLSRYDLPAEFVKGQAVHNDINNDGDHGFITRAFYAGIEHVSAEDQARVIRNLRMLYEAQRCKHESVLRYYRTPVIGVPRLLREGPDRDQVAARAARRAFWHGRTAPERTALVRLLVQIRYLHERMVDALSAALHRVRPDEARHSLSVMLVRYARLLTARRRADTEFVPLPSTEALANQLFILAENDCAVFLALLELLYQTVFPVDTLHRLLRDGAIEPAGAIDAIDEGFLQEASDLEDLRRCLALMEVPSAAIAARIKAQQFLVLETADLLYEELTTAPRAS